MKTTNNNAHLATDTSTFIMPQTFVMHEDAGHGWLAVPRALLKLLQIEDKISGYSYQRGDTVYLEEDLDAGTFVSAFLEYHGKKPNDYSAFNCTHHNDGDSSPIRNYARYKKK